MLRLSKLADYGALVLDYLQSHPQAYVSASEIAATYNLGNATVSKILKLLQHAQIVVSVRGHSGGYQLAKEPKDISIASVITALEGKPVLTECCDGKQTCFHDHHCALKGNWNKVNQVIMQVLEGLSLADMASPLNVKNMDHLRGIPISVENLR